MAQARELPDQQAVELPERGLTLHLLEQRAAGATGLRESSMVNVNALGGRSAASPWRTKRRRKVAKQIGAPYQVGPISYRALMRYGGIGSRSSVRSAIDALVEIGWLLVRPQSGAAFLRGSGRYILTPHSHRLMELAKAVVEEEGRDIQVEREMRKQQRQERLRDFQSNSPSPNPEPTAVHWVDQLLPERYT